MLQTFPMLQVEMTGNVCARCLCATNTVSPFVKLTSKGCRQDYDCWRLFCPPTGPALHPTCTHLHPLQGEDGESVSCSRRNQYSYSRRALASRRPCLQSVSKAAARHWLSPHSSATRAASAPTRLIGGGGALHCRPRPHGYFGLPYSSGFPTPHVSDK